MAIATAPDSSSVFPGLRSEVQRYFSDTRQKQQGPAPMYAKTAFILLSWGATYCTLLLFGPQHPWVTLVGIVVLMFFTMAVQFCVMHDVSHSSMSDRRLVNSCLNVSLTLVGACSILWHHKHVVRHHAHTNVPGIDTDIETGGMFRFRPADDFKPIHRFQHIYAWLLYAFIALEWVWYSDFIQTFGNEYRLRGKPYGWLWAEFATAKVSHVLLCLVLPYLAFQSVGVVVALYLAHWLCAGLVISVVFQLAHVGPDQAFLSKNDSDWAVHQLKTTADFAVNNRFLTWFVGGLNFQVEHHIFPRVCHIHYPQLQKIVKSYCQRHHVGYIEYPTLWSAIVDHYRHLRALSEPPVSLREQRAA